MQQNASWEENRRSDSQDISGILWSLNVHYHVHRIQPLLLSLARRDQSTPLQAYIYKIHFNTSHLRLNTSSDFSPSSFRIRNFSALPPWVLLSPLIHLPLFDQIINQPLPNTPVKISTWDARQRLNKWLMATTNVRGFSLVLVGQRISRCPVRKLIIMAPNIPVAKATQRQDFLNYEY
jgi:hypothetical protein